MCISLDSNIPVRSAYHSSLSQWHVKQGEFFRKRLVEREFDVDMCSVFNFLKLFEVNDNKEIPVNKMNKGKYAWGPRVLVSIGGNKEVMIKVSVGDEWEAFDFQIIEQQLETF